MKAACGLAVAKPQAAGDQFVNKTYLADLFVL